MQNRHRQRTFLNLYTFTSTHKHFVPIKKVLEKLPVHAYTQFSYVRNKELYCGKLFYCYGWNFFPPLLIPSSFSPTIFFAYQHTQNACLYIQWQQRPKTFLYIWMYSAHTHTPFEHAAELIIIIFYASRLSSLLLRMNIAGVSDVSEILRCWMLEALLL